ncbi:rabenosyn-5 isoform X2 [Rhodnius prolixus]|uniref:Putative fyve finger-containing protein n=2 Tax=Rhodnius TaxID=13248 RepID=A0A0P4VLD8_9HEMI
MAESSESQVLEGFICPICKSDLGTAVSLLSHFQDEHSEEQDLIKTFKDLLDKAKKKILKQESIPETSSLRKSVAPIADYIFDPQDLGKTFSHKAYFCAIREERLQKLAVPTNQLIIRLEKLLDKMPSDPLKRKSHEQSIVPWIDGDAVPRCPNCAGSFHLTRRQHHCRTCGGIMCNDCSHFMTLNTARRIIDKPMEDEKSQGNVEQLRLCIHCISLLEVREEKRVSRNFKPIISQFYERLANYREQADQLSCQYIKMSISLNAGESVYDLQEAQKIKVRLLKLAENIDSLSSKIAVLGKDTENPPQGQAFRLQTMIRSAFATYLRNQLLTLPLLPTEEQVEKAQTKRRQEITARIQEEKLRHAKLNNVVTSKSGASQQKVSNDPAVSLGQGWVPESKKVNESDDPLIEQMNIIRSYIKEAKVAHRYDEVTSLEENLHELKKEFWKKQQAQDHIAKSGESSEAASISSNEAHADSGCLEN